MSEKMNARFKKYDEKEEKWAFGQRIKICASQPECLDFLARLPISTSCQRMPWEAAGDDSGNEAPGSSLSHCGSLESDQGMRVLAGLLAHPIAHFLTLK